MQYEVPMVLCRLLSNSQLRKGAEDCLHGLIARKDKSDDKQAILNLLFQCMEVLRNVSETLSSAILQTFTEDTYHELKMLCQILSNLGTMYISVMSAFPPNFQR